MSKGTTIREEIEKLSHIYAQEVLSRPTRVVSLPGRKCQPQIVDTFLGYELKALRKRITCPDMSTARYLRIFAEIGMKQVKLPYDPSRVQLLATGLEHSLDRIKEHLLERDLDTPGHAAALRRVYARIRRRLAED